MGGIVLAPEMVLPVDAVTQTLAILAKRGVGKSTTARKIAEGFAAAGCQFVAVDPVGVWWGLRSSADGQGPGLNVYIFGGEHGDLPLEEGAGTLLADVVLESGASVILDLSDLGEGAMRRFLADFCKRLYERKARDRRPLHLILDEADEFAPQRIPPAGAALFGAIDRIVRRGRARGLGCTLISQRPAVVNKDVLTQCEVLIAMRVVHPRDRKALEEWATERDGTERTKEFAASLTSLDIGEAWIWSPGWLDVFERVRIDLPWTYDSSYTPKPGEARIEPSSSVDVDLDALGKRIEATREQAAAADPKRLHARVRELEAEVETYRAADYESLGRPEELAELAEANDRLLAELGRERLATEAMREALDRLAVDLGDAITLIRNTEAGWPSSEAVPHVRATRAQELSRAESPKAVPFAARTAPAAASPAAATPVRAARTPDGDAALGKAERSVLAVLAQFGPCEKGKLAMLAGYRWSGGFRNTLSTLRTAGHIEGANTGVMAITEDGLAALGDFDRLPTGRALLDYWLADPRLGSGERAVLQYAYDRYPDAVSGQDAAEATGKQYSGGFRNYLSTLRTAALIEGPNATFTASHLFFEGGR